MVAPVVIVGGGLSGLRVAQLLDERGVECAVIEARSRMGGRVLSASVAPGDDPFARYDLGPAWFWPAMQPRITRLAAELGVEAFPQYAKGAIAVERFALEPVSYARGYDGDGGATMRFAGGAQSLIEALEQRLPVDRIRRNARVLRLRREADGVEVTFVSEGNESTLKASAVVLALPPRLAAGSLCLCPALPPAIRSRWSDTPTWMAGQAKIVAVYERAFWRERGLAGSAQSFLGPLVEIHDAVPVRGDPALVGFVGLGAEARRALGLELLNLVGSQLARLFGPEAAHPKAMLHHDWAGDRLTGTAADASAVGGHPTYGHSAGLGADWEGHLVVAGSEAAANQGGYLEGALEAAEAAAARCRKLAR